MERIESGPPNIPAPAPPSQVAWSTQVSDQGGHDDEWDDEWDDDTYSEIPAGSQNNNAQQKSDQSHYGT